MSDRDLSEVYPDTRCVHLSDVDQLKLAFRLVVDARKLIKELERGVPTP